MIGKLPGSLTINGNVYDIRTDYRDILNVILAFHDEELEPREKAFILLHQVFLHPESIPKQDVNDAYTAAMAFIAVEKDEPKKHKKKPQTIDWEKDENMIFPAINKVAGFEVRAADYMHWWTFMGYFQGIDREDTYGFILSIRQKRAKHKKLEKYEQEFFNANREICDLNYQSRQEVENDLEKLFRELAGEE